MLFATHPFIEWIAQTIGVASITIEQALWSTLLVGLVFASVHLLTMLVTRWGDHDPTMKSLLFSVLLHVSCLSGLVAISPPIRAKESGPSDQQIVIRELRVESEEPPEVERDGNTPVWERLPEREDVEVARLDRSPLEFDPLNTPERESDKTPRPDIEEPDLTDLPDQPVVRPEARRNAERGVRAEAVVPIRINEETQEARPEVNIPSTSVVRRKIERSGLNELSVERTPVRGSIDRVEPEFQPSRELAAIPAPTDPRAFLKRGSEDQPRKAVGPAPSIIETEVIGTVTANSGEGSAAGSEASSRFTRQRTRTLRNRDDGAMQRFRDERRPTTPSPQPEAVASVREGITTTLPREGLEANVVRPNFDSLRPRRTSNVPATYRLRRLEQRKEIAQQFGGTEASERAVEASLQWLALHQHTDGYWDADGFAKNWPASAGDPGTSGRVEKDEEGIDRKRAGLHADAGVTALSILAFLGAGYTHEEGQYSEQVDRALRWLVSQQGDDGFLGGNATRYARMYCHAMATYALAEAYGMQTDSTVDRRLREPIARAVAYIIDAQNPSDGGWRYIKGQRSDMSMFGWQLMALKSAEIAGVPIPDETKSLMIQFLKDRSLGKTQGLAAYRVTDPPLPPTPSMTAEALFCKQMLGIRRSNAASMEAVEFLMQQPPKRSELNLYYWYYGTLAMYQYGGKPWRDWNESLRDILVQEQRSDGVAAGSWDPKGPWGPYGGRVYSTALSTLCLEVYYRFLPLYQMGGRYEEGDD